VSVVRRLYFYGVAFASLIMLAIGLSGLGGVLVDFLVPRAGRPDAVVAGLRSAVTQNAAFVLVGLPVWLLHWRLAQGAAGRDAEERGAALRRLFLYAVLLTFALRLSISAHDLLTAAGRLLLGLGEAAGGGVPALFRPIPWLLVAGALWAYHRSVVVADRRVAGETGASATLRRWYVYGLAFVGLMLLLYGTAEVLRFAWETIYELVRRTTVVVAAQSSVRSVTEAGATALTGLALWLVHWTGRAVRADADVAAQDRRSVLLPVYLFLALGVSVGFALAAAARMLYFALARLLGVAEPGGVGGPLLVAVAEPASVLAAYGVSWLYHRRALAAQALAQPELPRQAGVRRLYAYLVSLIALALLATGAGGLLWTLADALTNAGRAVNRPDWWREQVSLYATLVAVGLPVWLLHWGPVASARGRAWTEDEPRSLARRLYLYVALLAGVLILLGSGAVAARQVLDLLLGAAATGSAVTNLARALAVATVSAVVVFYHQRVLRADLEVSGLRSQVSGLRSQVSGLKSPSEADGAPARPSPERPFGIVYRRDSTEASEWFETADDARVALARLEETRNGVEWAALVRIEEAPPGETAPPTGSDLRPET
jgi:hypothetical protein